MGEARSRGIVEKMDSQAGKAAINLMGSDFEGASFYVDVVGEGTEKHHNLVTDSDLEYLYGIPTTLGDPFSEHASHISKRSCFNCGSTFHSFHACPDPRDPARIALAREELKELRPSTFRFGYRIHEWYEQRDKVLKWVDEFSPGKITVPELREALGLEDDELRDALEMNEDWAVRVLQRREDELPWYAGRDEGCDGGMLKWGYPPGYYSIEDPYEAMRRRILEIFDPPATKCLPRTEEETQPMSLPWERAEDEFSVETAFISLPPETQAQDQTQRTDGESFPRWIPSVVSQALSWKISGEVEEPLAEACNPTGPESAPGSNHSTRLSTPRRWAIYPTTLFQWAALPVSPITHPLPSFDHQNRKPSAMTLNDASWLTYTPDRAALWKQIVHGTMTTSSTSGTIYPWRRPEMWTSYLHAASHLQISSQPLPSSGFHSSPLPCTLHPAAVPNTDASDDSLSIEMDMSD
ncbi:uncharacterized protein EI90DRAFT_3077625 [Cantharellus anzutake]|uniref:uncharacterized protein n=1 Tax=Cantharellus anzutake TaxID=1750568 RepID=UPI0019037C7A|nr:uncharacterized protein EI90DRAFT_3077625 [Cantharellus anzutake]KAF8322860.1 hypothetical protein EI90DRAFT_3077625 [Cantharellus anzutake]